MLSINNAVVKSEIAYMLAKIVLAKKKNKPTICHYSSIYRATIDYFDKNGLDMDGLGKHSYRLYVPNDDVLDKVTKEMEVDKDFVTNEFNYIIEKIRLAKDKKSICHYSYLQIGTLKKLAMMGIKYEALGQHSYKFFYPEVKSKAWYRLINYGKVKRNADGSFAKKDAA